MAETSIQWTDHSINPIRARDMETEVACFMKQLGSNQIPQTDSDRDFLACWVDGGDPKGGNPDEWTEDLRVREFPR